MNRTMGRGGRTIIAEGLLVENAALSLPSCISKDDASDRNIVSLGFVIKVVPERFVQLLGIGTCVSGCIRIFVPSTTYFREPISMTSDNGHITLLRLWVISWKILLYMCHQSFILRIGCGARIFPDMRCFNDMLLDIENGGHDGGAYVLQWMKGERVCSSFWWQKIQL